MLSTIFLQKQDRRCEKRPHLKVFYHDKIPSHFPVIVMETNLGWLVMYSAYENWLLAAFFWYRRDLSDRNIGGENVKAHKKKKLRWK